jgi:TldD protein
MSHKRPFTAGIPRRRFLELGLKGGAVLVAAPSMLSCVKAGRRSAPLEVDKAMLDRVLRKALERGGDYADVYLENRVSRGILMEESKFKSAVFGANRGAGVRVIAGDKTGFAYTDEISEEALLRAAGTASAVARAGGAVEPVSVREQNRPSYITVKVPLGEVADEKRLEIMKRADEAALGYDPRIRMASIDYYDEVRGRVVATSEGLYLSDELPLIFFIVQTLGRDDKASHMGRERLSRHSGLEMFDDVGPEEVARACARESIAMLGAQDAPAGRMDVVMQNGWGGVLVHEAVGHPLEADNIARKTGVFVGKLGQKVATPVFTMVDDGTLPNFRGTTNFDDEGTPMRRNVLIEDGVLVKYMTDVLSAKQLGMERTGNGRRESFRYLPIPRMTNTFIEKGQDDSGRHPGLDPERDLRPEPERGQRQPDDGRLQFHLPRGVPHRERPEDDPGPRRDPHRQLPRGHLQHRRRGQRPRLRAGHLRQGPGGRGHGRPADRPHPGHQRRRLAGPAGLRADERSTIWTSDRRLNDTSRNA